MEHLLLAFTTSRVWWWWARARSWFAWHPRWIGAHTTPTLRWTSTHACATWTTVQLLFKVKKLTHKVEVGGDVWFTFLDKVIGIIEGETQLLHKIGNSYSHGPTNTCQAVHQNSTLLVTGLICRKITQNKYPILNILLQKNACSFLKIFYKSMHVLNFIFLFFKLVAHSKCNFTQKWFV